MPEDRSVLDRAAPSPTSTWRFGSGPDQVADIYLPESRSDSQADGTGTTSVLLVHGGYWRPEYDRTHLRPMAAALAAIGFRTVLAGYARVPGDPDAALADLRTALARIAEVTDDDAPVLVGHSAGGHLALVLAGDAAAPVRGCLALAPVADLREADRLDLDGGAVRAFLGKPAHARPDLDPMRLPIPSVPVTVVHGDADSLVPADLARRYCARSGSRLVELPGTGHFEVIDPLSTAWPVILTELTTLGRPPGIE